MTNFVYKVYWLNERYHKTTGKLISSSWDDIGPTYDSLQEAKADNPPDKHKYRFTKEYFEILEEQEPQEQ